MTANYLPWLVLLAIVIASLVLKGYVRLPAFGQKNAAIQHVPALPPNPSQPTRDHDFLGVDSYTLGIAFAKAKRAEVEHELAHLFATQAGEKMKAAFAAPFSEPAPAGPATPPASAPQ